MSDLEKTTVKPAITKWDLFKVFLASFFMQAVWNFRSLISIGFSICFFPILGKLCSSPQAKREFFQRHLKFFNSHPYFASFALGVSIRLEEIRASGQSDIPETLDRLKDLLISPLGAVGDRLFWATIKPASLILGMVGILVSPTVSFKILALFLTFLVYNIPHFYYRYQGIVEGYQHPLEIYKYVGQQRFETLRIFFVYIFGVALVALLIVFNYKLLHSQPGLIAVFLLSTVYALIFNKMIKNFYVVCLATFIFFLVVGILFF